MYAFQTNALKSYHFLLACLPCSFVVKSVLVCLLNTFMIFLQFFSPFSLHNYANPPEHTVTKWMSSCHAAMNNESQTKISRLLNTAIIKRTEP